MGSQTIMKKREKLIDVLDEKLQDKPLEKRIDVFRDFVYAVVDYLDEESLDALISEFSK